MRRGQANGREIFNEITEERTKELETAVNEVRLKLDNEWEAVDEAWTGLEKRMVKVGVRPTDAKDGMMRLNVSGWAVTVNRSTLTSASKSQARTVLGALFEGVWDQRVPRDAKGRIVLDESPKCFKYILNKLLGMTQQTTGRGRTSSIPLASVEALEEEDKPYVSYVKSWFGLTAQHNVDSEILRGSEVNAFLGKLQAWCPHEPCNLKLLYRASVDGFDASSFHAKCDRSTSTLTLFKVDSGQGCESIVGGYADTSWSQATATYPNNGYVNGTEQLYAVQFSGYSFYKESSKGFIFSLKNGTDKINARDADDDMFPRAAKYPIDDRARQFAIICHATEGPRFGNFDLWVPLGSRSPTMILNSRSNPKVYKNAHQLHYVDGRTILDVEVFCFEEPHTLTSVEEHYPVTDNAADVEVVDIYSFGSSMAESFALERSVLAAAKADLTEAEETVLAAVHALETIYGPEVAGGKEDDVIDLSVRGISITTLRSTLQACPESALAARFNE